MKTYLSAVSVIGVLAGLVVCGGCVSNQEYNKLRTANRRANEQLQKVKEDLRLAQTQGASLSAKLAQRDAMVNAKQEEVAVLENKNSDLRMRLAQLQKFYEQASAEKPPQPVGPIILLPSPVDKALREFAKDNPELIEYLPDYGMVKFRADFTFEKGSDDVSVEAVDALGKLAGILNNEAAADFHVYIAGHTDDIPIEKPATRRRHPTNWYLSVHRAVEVQKVLGKAALAPERIGVMGFGEYHAVAPNAPGRKGNPKNRRVEIWIVPPDRLLTATSG